MRNQELHFVVQLQSMDRRSARIRVCRFTESRETSCTDGKDNDCNGLIDRQEPQCKTVPITPPGSPCNRNRVCEAPR
jgi:hypothetical protein